MTTTITDLTATCDRIRSLAADLGIDLRVIETDHPIFGNTRVLIQVNGADETRFNRIVYGTPFRRLSLRDLLPRREFVTRLVPKTDLPRLLTYFEAATEATRAAGDTWANRCRWLFTAMFVLSLLVTFAVARSGHYQVAAVGIWAAWVCSFLAEVAEGDLAVVNRLTSGRVPA